MRWLLIERVLALIPSRMCRTEAVISEYPFQTEVLLIEMMAQTAGFLFGAFSDYQQDVVLAKIDQVEFFEMPEAGDTVHVEASAEHLHPSGAWFDATIKKNMADPLVASARIFLVNAGKLNSKSTHSTTFHPQVIEHFRLREKREPLDG